MVRLTVPRRLTNLNKVRQGSTVLTVSGIVRTFFSRLSFLSSISLALGDGPI